MYLYISLYKSIIWVKIRDLTVLPHWNHDSSGRSEIIPLKFGLRHAQPELDGSSDHFDVGEKRSTTTTAVSEETISDMFSL